MKQTPITQLKQGDKGLHLGTVEKVITHASISVVQFESLRTIQFLNSESVMIQL